MMESQTDGYVDLLHKALGRHPHEVSFWLMATDRELELGHIETPRKLVQL